MSCSVPEGNGEIKSAQGTRGFLQLNIFKGFCTSIEGVGVDK